MGNVGDALQNNVVTVTILPFVVAGILWPRSPIGTMFARYPRAVGGVAAVVMFTFTVARNTVVPWLSPVS